ncbi:hypothetical protein E2C01_072083 [Portunus trituberculatus]|uniref:Uncharacterized protein n=1 Tax=Portunus trituberculatus TaxID=210409 RepID=A0A5B7I690_PORTR|nr:hypothetical protein [Portunus trituberculatus]
MTKVKTWKDWCEEDWYDERPTTVSKAPVTVASLTGVIKQNMSILFTASGDDDSGLNFSQAQKAAHSLTLPCLAPYTSTLRFGGQESILWLHLLLLFRIHSSPPHRAL